MAKIQDYGTAALVPRSPSFRWYPDQPAQDKQVVQVQRSISYSAEPSKRLKP